MADAEAKIVLFLDATDDDRARAAAILFDVAAVRAGLAWRGASRGLAVDVRVKRKDPMIPATVRELQTRGLRDADYTRGPLAITAADLAAATIVIAFDPADLVKSMHERFPTMLNKVEGWSVSSGPGAVLLIDRLVADLIARLAGGDVRPRPFVPPPPAAVKKSGVAVKVGRETAGRRGKGVTTIWDLPLKEAELLELAAQLKQKCGSGGTVKDGRIEIQGDHRDRLVEELGKLGYTVKRSGG